MIIDVHHHYFPSSLNKAAPHPSGGWRTPADNLPWTPELSLSFMDSEKIDVAILSFPALSIGCVSAENRKAARERNLFMSEVCKSFPSRFGWFATMPFLDDIEGVLQEIEYVFNVLKADGVSLSSSYGEGQTAKYIGHEAYDEIWRQLNQYQAVVFLHGSQTPSSTPIPHEFLGLPIVEVPNETFKAAAHLVVTGRKRRYPFVKVILAHLGGNTAFLAPRVAALSSYMGCLLTPDEILSDFQGFYFDTALSTSSHNLEYIEQFAGSAEKILFGTDFPAVSSKTTKWFTDSVRMALAGDKSKLDRILGLNAVNLFPRLKNLHVQN